ncbi:hypothetical protein MMC12_000110 [Toensbergia leucococca]|nr:hypothetical protein [Toensbergia leucococca]
MSVAAAIIVAGIPTPRAILSLLSKPARVVEAVLNGPGLEALLKDEVLVKAPSSVGDAVETVVKVPGLDIIVEGDFILVPVLVLLEDEVLVKALSPVAEESGVVKIVFEVPRSDVMVDQVFVLITVLVLEVAAAVPFGGSSCPAEYIVGARACDPARSDTAAAQPTPSPMSAVATKQTKKSPPQHQPETLVALPHSSHPGSAH